MKKQFFCSPFYTVRHQCKTVAAVLLGAFSIFIVMSTLNCTNSGNDNPLKDNPAKLHPTPQGCWIEDSLPEGATWDNTSESFTWVDSPRYSGTRAHQSENSPEFHQHFFDNALSSLTIPSGSNLYTYVYLDPDNPPEEVMLQWNYGSTWVRAYWGSDKTDLDGPRIGDLPAKGVWTKLSVPAGTVGLENKEITGWAFSLYGGMVTWDASGID